MTALVTKTGIALAAVAVIIGPAFAQAATMGTGANAVVDVNVLGSSTGGIVVTASTSDQGSAGTGNDSMGANAGAAANLDLDRSILSADASGTGTAAMDSAQVRTDGDLSAYAKATLMGDDRAEHIQATQDSVSLSYDEPAHLFWVFPITMTATAVVSTDGKVMLHYPWYRFLAATDSAQLATATQTRVDGIMESRASGAGFTASDDARIIASLHDAMSTGIAANTTATSY